jgi:hypothetical protein
MKAIRNIDSPASDQLVWDSAAPEASLARVFSYVLDQAAQSQQWYNRPISGMIVVTVRPGETTKTQLALPSASTS